MNSSVKQEVTDAVEGQFSKAFNTGQSYRVQIYMNRILFVACIMLSFAVLFLSLTLMSIFPLKEYQPFFIEAKDRADQIFHVSKYKEDADTHRFLTEKMARRYIMKRETVDLQTEEQRYEVVRVLSNDRVFSEFKSLIESDKSFLKQAHEKRLTRSIIINHLAWISRDKNQIQIEYEMIDHHFDHQYEKRKMIATMTFAYNPQILTLHETHINPVGFEVTDYTITIKEEGYDVAL